MLSHGRLRLFAQATGVLFTCLTGCEFGYEEPPDIGEQTRSIGSFDKSLAGRADPIAKWLRDQKLDAKGEFTTDFRSVVLGIAKQEGCDERSVRAFTISDDLVPVDAKRKTNVDTFPRLIGTACSNQPKRARDFFVAASFKKPGKNDVDTRNLELFAWDPDARQHRFYAMKPVGVDRVKVEVEPKLCKTCHQTPSDLSSAHMPMVPIMNELVRPWTHWQAESRFVNDQGFPSHHFRLPPGLDAAPEFSGLEADFQGAATNLEDIIKESQVRVVNERLLSRSLGPGLSADNKLSQTMGLLRPLFCDEQVNYVSEEFDSGIYQMSAMVDPSLPALFKILLGPSGVTWSWATQESFHLQQASGTPVDLLPVRGEIVAEYEVRLAKLQSNPILGAADILRVRALDWNNVVLSDFRCELWKKADKRYQTAKNRPGIDNAKSLAAAAPIVFADIMQLRIGAKKPQPLLIGQPGKEVLAIGDGSSETLDALHEALAKNSVGTGPAACKKDGFCVLDLSSWGDAIEARLDALSGSKDARKTLRDERCRRIAKVLPRFPNRPALPLKEIFPTDKLSCP